MSIKFCYDIEKTCAVSGHRVLPKNFDTDNLYYLFETAIKNGYKYFLCGMALGFDTLCFQTLEKLRQIYDIKIIACIPCLMQHSRFNKNQKAEYERMIKSCDDMIVLQDNYDEFCMKKRNDYMVKNSSLLICYITRSSGGTYYTVKLAVEKNKKVIYVK